MKYIPLTRTLTLEDTAVDRALRRELHLSPRGTVTIDTATLEATVTDGPSTRIERIDPWLLYPALTKNDRRRRRYGVTIVLPDGMTLHPDGSFTSTDSGRFRA